MYFSLLSGNAVLLIIFAVIGHDTNRSNRGDLALFNILQIIFTLEFILSVPGILWYLGKVKTAYGSSGSSGQSLSWFQY